MVYELLVMKKNFFQLALSAAEHFSHILSYPPLIYRTVVLLFWFWWS